MRRTRLKVRRTAAGKHYGVLVIRLERGDKTDTELGDRGPERATAAEAEQDVINYRRFGAWIKS